MEANRRLAFGALFPGHFPPPVYCIAILLFVCFCVSPLWAGTLVEGIENGQVFPYGAYQAEIPFRAKGTGPLKARVVDNFSGKAVAWGNWEIVQKGQAEATPRPGSDDALRTASRDLKIPAVPIGGEYTIQFQQGAQTEEYKNILVGEIWFVAGGTNAFGASSGKAVAAIPWVRVVRNGRWDEGRDPAVYPPDGSSRWVTPWLRAAQNYYQLQGIPVGIAGYGKSGATIDAFVSPGGTLSSSLRSPLGRYGKGASVFFWWQGEADALERKIEGYDKRLEALASAVRRETGNPKTLIMMMQLGRNSVSPAEDTPYFGRVRDIQRRYALKDPACILVPTMYYDVSTAYRISGSGVQALGLTLGEKMREINTTRKIGSFGPEIAEASFVDRSGYRQIRVRFREDERLVLSKDSPEKDWLILDSKHQGFPELVGPARVEGGQVRFEVRGAALGSINTASGGRQGNVQLVNTGYVEIMRVSLRKGDTELLLDLKQPTELNARLCYCLMGNSKGSIRDIKGRHLPAFADIPIVKDPEQF